MHHDPDRAIVSPGTVTKLRRRVAGRVVLFPMSMHLEGYLARVGADRRSGLRFGTTFYYPPTAAGRPGAGRPAAFPVVPATRREDRSVAPPHRRAYRLLRTPQSGYSPRT